MSVATHSANASANRNRTSNGISSRLASLRMVLHLWVIKPGPSLRRHELIKEEGRNDLSALILEPGRSPPLLAEN
jgi:hypothetical protein